MSAQRVPKHHEGSKRAKRSGGWTHPERVYADLIVEGFHGGWLDVDEGKGTTLRWLLAQKLNCDPKRISKRMENSDYKGRKSFQRNRSLSNEDVKKKRAKLELWRIKFEESVENLRRAKLGIFTPADFLTREQDPTLQVEQDPTSTSTEDEGGTLADPASADTSAVAPPVLSAATRATNSAPFSTAPVGARGEPAIRSLEAPHVSSGSGNTTLEAPIPSSTIVNHNPPPAAAAAAAAASQPAVAALPLVNNDLSRLMKELLGGSDAKSFSTTTTGAGQQHSTPSAPAISTSMPQEKNDIFHLGEILGGSGASSFFATTSDANTGLQQASTTSPPVVSTMAQVASTSNIMGTLPDQVHNGSHRQVTTTGIETKANSQGYGMPFPASSSVSAPKPTPAACHMREHTMNDTSRHLEEDPADAAHAMLQNLLNPIQMQGPPPPAAAAAAPPPPPPPPPPPAMKPTPSAGATLEEILNQTSGRRRQREEDPATAAVRALVQGLLNPIQLQDPPPPTAAAAVAAPPPPPPAPAQNLQAAAVPPGNDQAILAQLMTGSANSELMQLLATHHAVTQNSGVTNNSIAGGAAPPSASAAGAAPPSAGAAHSASTVDANTVLVNMLNGLQGTQGPPVSGPMGALPTPTRNIAQQTILPFASATTSPPPPPAATVVGPIGGGYPGTSSQSQQSQSEDPLAQVLSALSQNGCLANLAIGQTNSTTTTSAAAAASDQYPPVQPMLPSPPLPLLQNTTVVAATGATSTSNGEQSMLTKQLRDLLNGQQQQSGTCGDAALVNRLKRVLEEHESQSSNNKRFRS